MDYKKFIDTELAKNLDVIYKTMYKLNLMDEKEFKKNIEILKKLHETPKTKKKNTSKAKKNKK